ncbi:hypothetical protein C8R43DRAFT_841636, partial [Mycena crocata]
DPLTQYGAVDGLLPGKSSEEAMVLRDIIIRWTLGHRGWFWNYLPHAIADLAQIKFTREDLVPYQDQGVRVYSLNGYHLELFAQITLAVHQILNGLYDFMGKHGSQRFPIDREWKMLRLMEENTRRSTLLMACSTMQMRLGRAVQHIKIQLNSIKRVFGQ